MCNEKREEDDVAEPRVNVTAGQSSAPPPAQVPANAPAPLAAPRCFVISPIGREGSDTRKRSDQIKRHIIDPVVTSLGFARSLRADEISESGRITRQIIQHVIEDELVVADLTDSNPNVYYELALRHALKLPFVQILAGSDPLPFDVAEQRTIMVDHHDLDSVEAAKAEMRRQIQALQKSPNDVDTPLSFALDIATLKGSTDPGDRTQGEILEAIQELRSMSSRTYSAIRRAPGSSEDQKATIRFIELVVDRGLISSEDLDSLVTQTTSIEHDQWVQRLAARREPRVVDDFDVPDPWATPSGQSYSDDTPF